jgi:hypothetical protein
MYIRRALAHRTRVISARLTYLTFDIHDHTLALMDREAARVFIDLTPQERREVEAALPAIAPVSGTAAEVLQRVLDSDPSGPGIRRASRPANAYAGIGETAKVFCVSTQTIRNWFDKGLLTGHLTPAGTRRLLREDLDRVADFNSRPRPGPKFSEAEIAEIIEHMRDE